MTAEKQVTNKHFERRWKVVDDSEWKKSIRRKVRRRKKIEVALEQIPYNFTIEITHSCKELKPAPTKSGYILKKCELILAQNRIYASNKFPYRINTRHGGGYRNGIHTAVVRKTSLATWKRNMHTKKREQEAQKQDVWSGGRNY